MTRPQFEYQQKGNTYNSFEEEMHTHLESLNAVLYLEHLYYGIVEWQWSVL